MIDFYNVQKHLIGIVFLLLVANVSRATLVSYDQNVTVPTGRLSRVVLEFDDDQLFTVPEMTVTVVSGPDHGNVITHGLYAYYEPDSGFTGSDSFTWKIEKGLSTSEVAQCTLNVDSSPAQDRRILLIVEEVLRPEIEGHLQQLAFDLNMEGYEAQLQDWSDPSASNLWAYLKSEYEDPGKKSLAGAIFVGDLPYIYDSVTEVINDVAYWYLQTFNQISSVPDIWVSRIAVPASEQEIVHYGRIFEANHAYRTGASRYPHRAYWEMQAWPEYTDYYYPNHCANALEVWSSRKHADNIGGVAVYHAYRDGMDVLDETIHGSNLVDDFAALALRPCMSRVSLLTACGRWRLARESMFTRRGGSIFAVGATTTTYTGAYVIMDDGTATRNFRTSLREGMSWGDALVANLVFNEIHRTVMFGDLSMGVRMSPSNSLPVLSNFTASPVLGKAPHTVVFEVEGNDPDDSVTLYEWFLEGYQSASVEPTRVGATLSSVTNTYHRPYVYTTEVHVEDEYQARAWSDPIVVIVNPDPESIMRVNAGYDLDDFNAKYEYIDSQTNLWLHDQKYRSDAWGSLSGDARGVANEVSNTEDARLYQRFREGGRFSYRVPMTNGVYALALHFADMYSSGSGERIMDIQAEDITIVTNFDVAAHVGINTAHTLATLVEVSDGELDFTIATNSASQNHAYLNAFSIAPAGSMDVGPTITSSLEEEAAGWTPFSYIITASGRQPIEYEVSGLPDGLALDGNTISGTPTQIGLFEVDITATNVDGSDTATLALNLIMPQTGRIGIAPLGTTVEPGGTTQFVATAYTEYGDVMPDQPVFDWSVSSGGSIDTNGIFTADPEIGGPYVVTAIGDGCVGMAILRVSGIGKTNVFVWKEGTTGSWSNPDNWTPSGFSNSASNSCVANDGVLMASGTFYPDLALLGYKFEGGTLTFDQHVTINGGLRLMGGTIQMTSGYSRDLDARVELMTGSVSRIALNQELTRMRSVVGSGTVVVTNIGSSGKIGDLKLGGSFNGSIEVLNSDVGLADNYTGETGDNGSIWVSESGVLSVEGYAATWTIHGGITLNGGTVRDTSGDPTVWTSDTEWTVLSGSVFKSSDGAYQDVRGNIHGDAGLTIECGGGGKGINFRGSGSTYCGTITVKNNGRLYLAHSGALSQTGDLASLKVEQGGAAIVGGYMSGSSAKDAGDVDIKIDTLLLGGRGVPAGVYSQSNPLPYEGFITFHNASSSLEVMTLSPSEFYVIEASAGEGGAILPAGDVIVDPDNDQAFEIVPASGNFIDEVIVDGVSLESITNHYLFSEVVSDHTISVSFFPIQIKTFEQANGSELPVLQFMGKVGYFYEVLYKDDLASEEDWQVYTNNLAGTGGVIEIEIDNRQAPQRFYRLRAGSW